MHCCCLVELLEANSKLGLFLSTVTNCDNFFTRIMAQAAAELCKWCVSNSLVLWASPCRVACES